MLADPIDRPAAARAASMTHARAAPSPIQMPKRAAEDIRLRQRLQRGVQWVVGDPDAPWGSFELALASSGEAGASAPIRAAPALTTAHGVLHLCDDTLVTIATGLHLPHDVDDRARDGLLRLACTAWCPALAQALGGVPTPLPVGHDAPPSGKEQPIAAVLTLVSRDGSRQVLPLRTSRRTLLAWASAPGWRPLPVQGPMSASVAAIALTVGLWLGRIAIRHAQLSTVRTGDAFWLPSDGRAKNGPLCLVSGRRLIHLGQVDHLTREFQGWGSTGTSPSNSLHAFSPSSEPRNVDALTVDLDFIVGRVAMTVGELSALAAGQIVPLEALTPATVRIVAHGTELGAGQLVEVEGRLAVEILQWGSPR